jgi:FixJ family two-component response regulator
VKAHRAQVMRKMGAASLAELIRMAEALEGFVENDA